jgi:hypothetical protein
MSLSLDAQQSNHELLSNEQFYSVKQLSEDSGRSVKLALTLYLSQLMPSLSNRWTDNLTFTTDYAYATSFSYSDGVQDRASLHTASLAYSLSNLSFNATAEHGGINPSWMETDKTYNNIIFSIQLKNNFF